MEKQSQILVVDDDIDLCANLRKILEMHDYAVDIACNANDGMALCRATQYDIALVDIQLGANSGHDLVETLAPISPSTECIYMTGHASLESAIEAVRQEHIVSYETKPLDMDRLLAIIRQVIKRKRAEEALERSHRMLQQERKMFIAGPVVVFQWRNAEGWPVEYVSPNINEVCGFSVEELTSGEVSYAELIPSEDRERVANEVATNSQSGAESFTHQPYRIVRKDGTRIWIDDYTTILRNEHGIITHYLGYIIDITERAEQIKSSLKEKEVLLQEVHHRVKNNLQVISSLLGMSRLRTRDQQAIDLLTDARARIHSMSMIHAQLYQSEQFEQIDMGSHIRKLVNYLSTVYAEQKRITPRVEASGVCLSLIQAIPCALILNELIANVFKHAFKEGQAGALEISMQQSPEDAIVLRVKDNGIGIRDDIDLEHTDTLGLKLVRILVQQLRGEVQVIRDMGTEFMITFDI